MRASNFSRLEKNAPCLCIGAANIDIRCLLSSASVDGTSNPASISRMVGGAALNTARMIASCGGRAIFSGLLGDDESGQDIAKALAFSGVEDALIYLPGHTTGQYISMIEPDGTLIIAANDMSIHREMTIKRIEKDCIPAMPDETPVLFCDANIPAAAIAHLIARHSNAIKCATTVSPAKAGRLKQVCPNLDVLFTNVVEACSLLERTGYNAGEAASELSKTIPCGIVSNGENPLWHWQDGEVTAMEIEPVKCLVDVTGAGDALAAGTIAAIVEGAEFSAAVRKGVDAAQKVLGVAGPYAR